MNKYFAEDVHKETSGCGTCKAVYLASDVDARIAELEKALRRIARWHGEFPDSGRTWDDGTPMSYGACNGSNGERDFMRQIALDALNG